MPRQASTNSTYDSVLSDGMLSLSHWNGPRPYGRRPGRRGSAPMYQSVPQSIGRSLFSSKNRPALG